MKKERKFQMLSDVYTIFTKGVIYKESYISINNHTVSSLAEKFPSHWQEVFEEEPTLESLTDQIKELAKKKGLKCDVILEKKKDVEVVFFCVSATGFDGISELKINLFESQDKIKSKRFQIIKAIKTILEN